MENITLLSVHATYGLALVMFGAMAAWRFYAASVRERFVPPSPPLGKVAVWFYRPLDLVGIAMLAGVFYLLAMSSAIIGDSDKPVSISAQAIASNIGLQFMLAGIAMAIVIRRVDPMKWLGLRWKEWPWVMLIAPAAVVGIWIFSIGLQLLGFRELLEKLGVAEVQAAVAIFQKENDTSVLILMAFTAAVVAPICEEVVFRGYLYPAVKRFVGPWVSALCTALMFSAAHGSVSALLPLFVFGLVLAALYDFTGSLWAPMAAHFLFNSASVTMMLTIRFFDLPMPQ